MKIILLASILIQCDFTLFAQKPPLDLYASERWPKISNEALSNDGRFLIYSTGSDLGGITLNVRNTDGSWGAEMSSGRFASFTDDSKHLVFSLPNNEMQILSLETHKIDSIPNIRSFKIPCSGGGKWIAYLLNSSDNNLILLDLMSGESFINSNVCDYVFCDNGSKLLIQTFIKSDSISEYRLSIIDLLDNRITVVWNGSTRANSFVFDQSGKKLAFLRSESGDSKLNTIMYYREEMSQAIPIVSNSTKGCPNGLLIAEGNLRFGFDGHKLFFDLERQEINNPVIDSAANVDIWNYNDKILQSNQLYKLSRIYERRKFRAVISEPFDILFQLENEEDNHDFIKMFESRKGKYLLTKSTESIGQFWLKTSKSSLYIINTDNAKRTLVRAKLDDAFDTNISPAGKYAIWYDRSEKNYFTYNIYTGVIRNISKAIPYPIFEDSDVNYSFNNPYGFSCWFQDDGAVLIYDRYDIWKVDPDGQRPPIRITLGYGRRNYIKLRYLVEGNGAGCQGTITYNKILLAGFNEYNKNNGFFELSIQSSARPTELIMSPMSYYFPFFVSSFASKSSFLVKARDVDTYLVKPTTTTKYPNLCVTSNFKTFREMSNLHPENEYNWMTSELIHWNAGSNKYAEGILYKPADFDNKKKYPIIFYIYERQADGLNSYIQPGLFIGPINISYFVSNGYLVCCPDIHYRIGYPGESVYDYVVSAAKFMSKFPWVDTAKMGLQGHSMGGYEVNYLITKSNRFAAAASAAGVSDLVSFYGSIRSTWGNSFQLEVELGQNRIGANLWAKPDLYVRNSPIFAAHKVTTPLLIMHNKIDNNVPWQQGVEYFNALYRLGKKVWMLQYDNERHSLTNRNNQLDYSKRLIQFFDYYLKNMPMPKWMDVGVPANLKRIETGFDAKIEF